MSAANEQVVHDNSNADVTNTGILHHLFQEVFVEHVRVLCCDCVLYMYRRRAADHVRDGFNLERKKSMSLKRPSTFFSAVRKSYTRSIRKSDSGRLTDPGCQHQSRQAHRMV